MATTFATITGGNQTVPASGGIRFGGGNRTLAIQGTFNGGDIQIQGSLDGSTFINLKDAAGNNIVISSSTIMTLDLGVSFLRFQMTGSSGSTDVKVLVA